VSVERTLSVMNRAFQRFINSLKKACFIPITI